MYWTEEYLMLNWRMLHWGMCWTVGCWTEAFLVLNWWFFGVELTGVLNLGVCWTEGINYFLYRNLLWWESKLLNHLLETEPSNKPKLDVCVIFIIFILSCWFKLPKTLNVINTSPKLPRSTTNSFYAFNFRIFGYISLFGDKIQKFGIITWRNNDSRQL